MSETIKEKKPVAPKKSVAPAKETKDAAAPKAAKKTPDPAAKENAPRAAKKSTTTTKLKSAAYATGKRKNAIARVYLKKGKGNVLVNGKDLNVFFPLVTQQNEVLQPFNLTETTETFHAHVFVSGGGYSAQAQAAAHAIAKALQFDNAELRPTVKAAGLLTRDSRIVERKKPGLRKARRKEQFSKR